MAGLSAHGASGPSHAGFFIIALCLSNLVGTAAFSCFGILCDSSAVATILSVLFILLSMLFCGFIVNLPTLEARGAWLGPLPPRFLSFLYYFAELVISDELIGQTVVVRDSMNHGIPPFFVGGEEVLAHLGYQLNCSRIWGVPNNACWYDLYVPAATVLVLTGAAMVLLGFCVKDPH